VAGHLHTSLTEMATWLDLSEVTVEPRGDLAADLARCG
jgi:uncharacterized protein YcaQ